MMSKTLALVLVGCVAALAHPTTYMTTNLPEEHTTTSDYYTVDFTTQEAVTESQDIPSEFSRVRRHIEEEPEIVTESVDELVVNYNDDDIKQTQIYSLTVESAEPMTTENPTTEEIDVTTIHSRHAREVESTEIPTTESTESTEEDNITTEPPMDYVTRIARDVEYESTETQTEEATEIPVELLDYVISQSDYYTTPVY